MVLRIERVSRRRLMILRLSGRLQSEHLEATALAKSDPVVLIRDDPRQEQDLEQARVAASSSHAAGVVARSSVRDQAE